MSGSKLYVGNVPEGAKEKELQELFAAFGELEEVALMRGYGFVHFMKQEDASAALNALDDSEFGGSHIQVQFARTKGHGYGRGSGPPRPRFGRGYDREGGSRPYRDSNREGGGYRDSYRDKDRDRYDYRYEDSRKDYRSLGSGSGSGDYYGDYDRYRSSGSGGVYDHDRYYESRSHHDRDYGSSRSYGDYRSSGSGAEHRRSRSPMGRGGSEYYSSSRDRGSYYGDRERELYREDASRSRRW